MAKQDATQLFEERARNHTPIGRVEFEHEGTTMLYDYDVLNLEQKETARSIYQIGTEMAAKPPESITKLLLAGGHMITMAAFGFLLLRKMPDGTLEEFSTERAQGQNLEFVKRLPAAKHGDRLMECQEDFFIRAGVSDLEQIRQLRAYAAAQEGIQKRLTDLVQGALRLSNKSLDNALSGNQENSDAEPSSKEGTPASSGTARKVNRRSSKKRGG